jgi:hypothetical protein
MIDDDELIPEDATEKLLDSAEAMGIEIDREEADRWIAAMSAESSSTVDRRREHRRLRPPGDDGGSRSRRAGAVPADGRDRRVRGPAAAGDDRPRALGIGGAGAHPPLPGRRRLLRARPHPADTREEACAILADVIREKALATLRGKGHRLQEVKFGNWPVDASVGR